MQLVTEAYIPIVHDDPLLKTFMQCKLKAAGNDFAVA